MSYQGYLIKVGDYEIPMDKYIKADSYSVYRAIQDLDSYTDADGLLHRNVLSHVPNKVEFETPAMLIMDVLASGAGVAFGKVAEKENAMEIAWDLYQDGNTYIKDLQEYHIVAIRSVTLSSDTAVADGSTWTATGTCTVPGSYAGYIIIPRHATYGYPYGNSSMSVSDGTGTVSYSYRNASGGTHTLSAYVYVLFYI